MKKWKWTSLALLLIVSMGAISCMSTAEHARRDEIRRIANLEEVLKNELAEQIRSEDAQVYRYEGMLVVSLNEKFLFDGESATLKESFTDRLLKVANILKQAPEKVIRVVGHTAVWDSQTWASSWDLGAQRAVNVVRFLQEKGGLDPQKLVASTLGQYQPIATNTSEPGRQKNRRVEIILMDRNIFDVRYLQEMAI